MGRTLCMSLRVTVLVSRHGLCWTLCDLVWERVSVLRECCVDLTNPTMLWTAQTACGLCDAAW